jgi:hypothetical protein
MTSLRQTHSCQIKGPKPATRVISRFYSPENLTFVSLACAVRVSTIRVPGVAPTGLAPSSM